MLLDCGATALLQMNRFHVDPDRVDRILITHFHGDHLSGLPFVLLHDQVIAHRSRPLDLLGPPGLKDALLHLMEGMYPGFHFDFEIRFTELSDRLPVVIAGFTVLPLKMDHRPESLGYRITGPGGRAFAFSGDTRFNAGLGELYDGVDVGILELSLEEQPERGTGHVAFSELRDGRELLRAKRMFYSHLTDRLAELVEAEASRSSDFGHPLKDGMEIHFLSQTMHSAGH